MSITSISIAKGTRAWWVVAGVLVAAALVAASLAFHNLDHLFSPTVDTTPVHLPRHPALDKHAEVVVEQRPVQVVAKPDRAARKLVQQIVGPAAEVRVEGPGEVVKVVERDPSTGQEASRTLATVLQVPPAPWGGDLAVTVGEAGDIGGTFKPRGRPWFALGGETSVGGELDLGGRATAYVRQDLLRVGKLRGYGRGWASYQAGVGLLGAAPLDRRQQGLDYGVGVGFEVRFGKSK